VNYTNASCYGLVLALGSIADQGTLNGVSEQAYAIAKHALVPSTASVIDLVIQTIAVYTVASSFLFGWEVLNFLLRKLFRNSFFGQRPTLVRWLHFGNLQLVVAASAVSVQQDMFIVALGCLVVLIIDLNLRLAVHQHGNSPSLD